MFIIVYKYCFYFLTLKKPFPVLSLSFVIMLIIGARRKSQYRLWVEKVKETECLSTKIIKRDCSENDAELKCWSFSDKVSGFDMGVVFIINKKYFIRRHHFN